MKALPVLGVLWCTHLPAGHAQALSVAAAAGPVFLPGSGARADWQALLAVGIQQIPVSLGVTLVR
ncbi:MAG TPA: hypothetical protein VFG66_05325 [Gemmatimonadales bacterium]|nr:hypothetical protein [Gemmatimonadales bacterium]